MGTTLELKQGESRFTPREIIERVARFKGLELRKDTEKTISPNFAEYYLTTALLRYLDKRGIRRQPRPDDVFTLVDENPQDKPPQGWANSNYWNFKSTSGNSEEADMTRYNLLISLGVDFEFRPRDGNVAILPRAYGSFLSPCDPLPNFHMFKALTDRNVKAPAVAKEIAASEGKLIVSFAEIGLGGLCSLRELFVIFAEGNADLLWLGEHPRVFDPCPLSQRTMRTAESYIIKEKHKELFDTWRDQLNAFKDRLVVNMYSYT